VEKGRTIYAGIQKFVAFIMSVHIAEVLQIFICIVAEIPVMRTPLQILFLILVTDLPPSIALGMEPGDKSILKAQPRPKEEPIVIGWMWMSINMNGAILSGVIIGIYMFALQHFCDGAINQSDILKVDNFEENLAKARTVAFISLVYSENIRAYIARSFDKPVWVNLCGNKEMLKAIILAQLALYIAVLVPGVSDKILGLRGLDIGGWGWAVSLIGPVATVILCELAKIITSFQVRQYQAKLAKKRESEQKKWQEKDASELPTLMKQPSDPAIRKVEEVDV
jgi:magnesium-transporting ATPase (P-type)